MAAGLPKGGPTLFGRVESQANGSDDPPWAFGTTPEYGGTTMLGANTARGCRSSGSGWP